MQLSDFSMSSNNTNIFSNLSELSQSELSQIHQTGGFFNLFCEETKIDKAVLEAIRLKKYDIVDFFVDKDLITSYQYQDENGNTLLHYLALDYDSTWKIIEKILKRLDVKSFINIQNKNGDTPLILAVIGAQHDLCEKLIAHGADKAIKNKQQYCVDTETDTQTYSPINVKPLRKENLVFNKIKSNKQGENQVEIFNPIIEFLKQKPVQSNTTDPYSFTAMQGNTETDRSPRLSIDSMDTEKFIIQMTNKLNKRRKSETFTDDLLKQLEQNGGCGCANNQSDLSQNEDTDYLLNEFKAQNGGGINYSDTEQLINTLKHAMNQNQEQQGGNTNYSETEQLLNKLKNYMDQPQNYDQQGGVKKKGKAQKNKTVKKQNKHVMGKRTIPKFNEGAIDNDDMTERRGDELSRIINNQTSEIISCIIKKIQEIITKNKKDFEKVSAEVAKGTEEVARIYKAALWSEVKNDSKNTTKSSLDVAVEVQKILSKEKLLKVDYKEWESIIKKHQEEKEKERKNKMNNVQESSTIGLSSESSMSESDDFSKTSSAKFDDVDMSETSY